MPDSPETKQSSFPKWATELVKGKEEDVKDAKGKVVSKGWGKMKILKAYADDQSVLVEIEGGTRRRIWSV